jgi:aryl-alcohol dehydrogenase-like predicted oxidoreductase
VVGRAVASSSVEGGLAREGLFLQTKFAFQRGLHHRLDYDPEAPIALQVEQSFTNSLEHLDIEVIDPYLLHVLFTAWAKPGASA